MADDSFIFGCRGNTDKVGVLIAQLGTPDAPTPRALKKYLKQFLSDRRVIEVNKVLWWFLLNFVILLTRPKRSARLYKRIWREDGSPLLVFTQRQTEKLRQKLKEQYPNLEVEFGMRYGSPSLASALDKLRELGCSKILLIPMYPQYSAATTASVYDDVFQHILKQRNVPTLKVVEPFFAKKEYLEAVVAIIKEEYQNIPTERRPEKLVLSYHGIPQKYVDKGDTYCCHCSETTEFLKPLLGFAEDEVVHTYQSRFGKDPWLIPYTDRTIESLAEQGIKRIAVALPGFTTDCLETLDEIGNEARESFLEHGGEELFLIPCLNDHPKWIEAMYKITIEELGTWLQFQPKWCRSTCPIELARAKGIKA